MNVSVEYIFDIKPSPPAAAGFFVSPHLSLHSSDEKIHSYISLIFGFAALPSIQDGYQ